MRIVCIANQKGGVGKTTLVAGLAGALCARGLSVLMLDLDPHASLSHWFGMTGGDAGAGSHDLYRDIATVADVARPVAEAGISLVPAQPNLATLERSDAMHPGAARALVRAFRDVLPYDYVLLDCPPTLGVLMISALAAADLVIIPTQTEPLALRAIAGMLRSTAMVAKSRGRALPCLVVPTLFDKRTRVANDSLAELRARTDCDVWNDAIPTDNRLREASRNLATPAAFDPDSRGALALARLAAQIVAGGALPGSVPLEHAA
jgi:chromosome partitioning protein